MILIDANLLLYAYLAGSPQHSAAKAWLEKVLSGKEAVGIPWTAVLAFLRVGTTSGLHRRPMQMPEAIAIISEWFEQPHVFLVGPGERHWEILSKLLAESQVFGPLVMDADLAALAIERGATLCTADHDFKRVCRTSFALPS